jgi:hypothetical protein
MRPIMHMTMRKYRQVKGTPEAAIVWVKKNLMPILKKSKWFKAYYAVAIGSSNVFESEEAANNANQQVCNEAGAIVYMNRRCPGPWGTGSKAGSSGKSRYLRGTGDDRRFRDLGAHVAGKHRERSLRALEARENLSRQREG